MQYEFIALDTENLIPLMDFNASNERICFANCTDTVKYTLSTQSQCNLLTLIKYMPLHLHVNDTFRTILYSVIYSLFANWYE